MWNCWPGVPTASMTISSSSSCRPFPSWITQSIEGETFSPISSSKCMIILCKIKQHITQYITTFISFPSESLCAVHKDIENNLSRWRMHVWHIHRSVGLVSIWSLWDKVCAFERCLLYMFWSWDNPPPLGFLKGTAYQVSVGYHVGWILHDQMQYECPKMPIHHECFQGVQAHSPQQVDYVAW